MNPTTPVADTLQTGVRGSPAFATMHWSLIARAADGSTAEGRTALEELCRLSWYPLYLFAVVSR